MLRKYTTAELGGRLFGVFLTYPLDMWLFGKALAIVGGPHITRVESFFLVWALWAIAGMFGEGHRSAIASMIK